MRRLALAMALLCAAWAANAQTCEPLGRPLIQINPTACPNTSNWASPYYAPPPYWNWSSYSWSVTNGTIQGPADGQYLQFTIGTEPATVSLTATDGGGCSYSESVTVGISNQVPMDLMSNSQVCPNAVDTVVAMSRSGYSFTNYQWSIQNGEIVENNGQSIRYRAGMSGAVHLSVTADSSASCTGSGTLDIPIGPPYSPLYVFPDYMCVGGTTTAMANSYYFDTFDWSVDAGEIVGPSNTAYVTVRAPETPGLIHLTVNASSTTTGCTVTLNQILTVNEYPAAPQVVAPTAAVCDRVASCLLYTSPSPRDS